MRNQYRTAMLTSNLMVKSRWYGWLCYVLVLCTSTLQGQLTEPFSTQVQLPAGGGTYHITFQAKFAGAGISAGPDGSIVLPKAGKVLLRLQDYKVTGPDPAIGEQIRLRLELPATAGGNKLHLAKDISDRATLSVKASGRLGLFSKIIIINGERPLTRSTFDLTRVFTISATEVVAEATPDPVPSVNEPVTVNENQSVTSSSSDNVAIEKAPPEKTEWEKDFERLSAEAFVDKWSNKTTLVRKKLREIDLKPSVEELSTNRYALTFDYVENVQLDSVTGGTEYKIESDVKKGLFGHRIVVAVLDAGTYRLHLSDKSKINGVSIVALDNLLGGQLTASKDSVSFTFQGGVPPYELLFYQDGGLKGQLDIGYDSVRTVTMDQLRDQQGGGLLPGTYTVKLQDQQKSITWNYNGDSVTIVKPEKKPVDTKIPLMVGGGLAVLTLLLIIRGVKRRRRRARIRENLNGAGTSPTIPSPAPAAAPSKTSDEPLVPESEVIATAPPVVKEVGSDENTLEPVVKTAATSGGFRVTRRAKTDNTTRDFHPDQRPQDFLPLHLERNWTESRIATVFFNKQSIFVLDDFLRRENTSKIAASGAVAKDGGWERNEAIPEIGGMLMGQYHLGKDGQTYRVSVEEFIPLKAKTQNVVKVQIDPMSLARDLSAAQDAHPELTVIGWFHTHPGHGLFLSAPDLKVQHGQFREPYHFAMEIDSLTENLDTAFFTYLPSGKMNNRDTRRPDSDWFSWSEIEKFTRRNSPN